MLQEERNRAKYMDLNVGNKMMVNNRLRAFRPFRIHYIQPYRVDNNNPTKNYHNQKNKNKDQLTTHSLQKNKE